MIGNACFTRLDSTSQRATQCTFTTLLHSEHYATVTQYSIFLVVYTSVASRFPPQEALSMQVAYYLKQKDAHIQYIYTHARTMYSTQLSCNIILLKLGLIFGSGTTLWQPEVIQVAVCLQLRSK